MESIYKTTLIVDIAIFSAIILFYYIKSDEINPIFGYRTKQSMKNQKNWKFAQTFFFKNWLYSIPIMLASQLPLLFDSSLTYLLDISFANFIVYLLYLVYITEKKLKKLD